MVAVDRSLIAHSVVGAISQVRDLGCPEAGTTELMATSEAHLTTARQIIEHAIQVGGGLIPEVSPPDVTLPQPTDRHGLPWCFGPDYKPTPEALAEFAKPPGEPTPK